MLSNMSFSAFLTILLLPIILAYSNPGSCSGACNVHDPSVIQRVSDGTYFWFSTGGGIAFAKSSSLTGPWTSQGQVLTSGSSISVSGNDGSDLWAPEVKYVSGTYYMYYAVSSFGSQVSTIGVATSTTMEAGSWTDHGSVGISSTSGKPYNAIDPNLIQVGSANYLNFGSFWNDIYQCQLSTLTNKGSYAAYQIEYNATGTRPSEGSYMFYYSGYYYLLWSSGICCGYDTSKPATGAEYHISMCRSTTATGGFVDKSGNSCTSSGGTVLLASHGTTYGPGGQGVFADSSRGLVLYYHYANTDVGLADSQYLLGWNTLTWSSGWPSV